MKTLEEVQQHLANNGYTREAISRILGFLIGSGVKRYDEEILVKYGAKTFDDFFEWWNEEDSEEDKVLCDLMEYLSDKYDNAKCEGDKERFGKFIDFLIEQFYK